MFQVEKVTQETVQWIRDWFDANGAGCNAVIGLSGGKDSTVVAGLCVEALGRDRVIGVLMPNGVQPDIDDSKAVAEFLQIQHYVFNIHDAYEAMLSQMTVCGVEPTSQTVVNLPPRLRMSALYAISQSKNGRVANTCNLSEDWVGYSTRYGDAAGDFSPLGGLTVREVKAVGKHLGLPAYLVDKTPSDGLCGSTDEDKLGFTYAALDCYIREGICEDAETKAKIDHLHTLNQFKLKPIPAYVPAKELL